MGDLGSVALNLFPEGSVKLCASKIGLPEMLDIKGLGFPAQSPDNLEFVLKQ